MEKLQMKLSVINKGFSLVEVVVALFILSVSVITIYNLILTTAVSSYDLEQRYLAKEVANNRISLINTIEKSSKPIDRTGQMIMGGQKWIWDESIVNSQDDNFFEYKISVKLDGSETYIYFINGYYTK
tara:strand:- start:966 stop:1349 length:384 start_codon:yes stop_codon:yes gene_type:complete